MISSVHKTVLLALLAPTSLAWIPVAQAHTRVDADPDLGYQEVCLQLSPRSVKLRLTESVAAILIRNYPQFRSVKPELCGDGIDNDCDGSIDGPPCSATGCGDGLLEPPEECDDGNTISGDGCDATCMMEPVCGNGLVEGDETCEGEVEGACCVDCDLVVPSCGDGIIDCTEGCDDGNTISGDGCDANCMVEPVCGNGIVEPGESCEGDGEVEGGCCAECQVVVPGCGNGVVDCGEECDDGGASGPQDRCSDECKLIEALPSPFAVNGPECERCAQQNCWDGPVEGSSLYDLARADEGTVNILTCMLVTGCVRDEVSSGVSCYCGNPGYDGKSCLTPDLLDPFEDLHFAEGQCRGIIESVSGAFFPGSLPKLSDPSLQPSMRVADACLRDRCLEQCQPQVPPGEFRCGDRRCKIDSEYCYSTYPGMREGRRTHACLPLLPGCFDDGPDPACEQCVDAGEFGFESGAFGCYGDAQSGFSASVAFP